MMHYLNDLVWVGNTLYPRWLVWGVCVAIIVGVIVAFWSAWKAVE